MAKKTQKPAPEYASLTVSQCPSCGGFETYATSTQGPIQYRKCRRIGCIHRHNAYPVRRTPVKAKEQVRKPDDATANAPEEGSEAK